MLNKKAIHGIRSVHRGLSEQDIQDIDRRYTEAVGRLKGSGRDLGRIRLVPEGGKLVDLKILYEENGDFRKYVDGYRAKYNEGHSIPLEEALRHELVRQYAMTIVK